MLHLFARPAALLVLICLLGVGLAVSSGSKRVPIAIYINRVIDSQNTRTETVIYLQDIQTGRQLVLFRNEGWFRVSISPYSARAVMWDTVGNSSDVFTVNLISERKQRVMHNVFVRFQADPTWARTGSRFAFVAMDSGFFRDSVVIVDFHDHSTTYVSSGGESSFHPTFSPDGSSLIYVAPWRGQRVLYRWHGINESPTRVIDGEYSINPAWSPDGSQLVYTARQENRDQLYLFDSNTNEEVHLMHDPSVREGAAPVWSPDSRYIAYTARESIAAQRRVYLIDTHDDYRVWRLVDADSDDASYLAWSKDGRWLAFRADVDGTGMKPHLINIDTGEQLTLPENTSAGLAFAGLAGW